MLTLLGELRLVLRTHCPQKKMKERFAPDINDVSKMKTNKFQPIKYTKNISVHKKHEKMRIKKHKI